MAIGKSPGTLVTAFQLSILGTLCLLICGVPTAANSVTSDGSSLEIQSNRRLIETKTFTRHSLQQGDTNILEQVHVSGERNVEPASDVKHEDRRQRLNIFDRNLEIQHERHHEQFPMERNHPDVESEPRNVRKRIHAHLEATFVTRSRRRQLHQKAEGHEEGKQTVTNAEDESKVEGKESKDSVRDAEQEAGGAVNTENEGKELLEQPVKDAEQEAGGAVNPGNEEGKELPEQPAKDAEKETSGRANEETDKKESEEESKQKTLEEKRRAADHYNFPEPYLLGPKITDWDQQRAKWLEENPHMRFTDAGKPRVLLVTGSSGFECPNGRGDNFYVRSLKLKMDYARLHGYELFYNLAEWDPLFNGFWVKLPTFRNLMLKHPEIEWIFWLDSDAIFTDVLYEAPLEEFDGYNMVMEGWFMQLMKNSWLGANDGVVLLRNCQWSLDLIDKWSPFGADGAAREMYGEMMTEFFIDRDSNYPADDQAALSYLMIMDEAVMSKIKLLESKVQMSSYWKNTVEHYEKYLENYHPGLGDSRWPWVTHFTGCSLCFRERDHPELKECMDAFQRAYNFADNQILAYWGFQYKTLSGPELVRIRNETSRPVDYLDVNPWQERIDQLAAASKK